jgi:hypothetical protein
MHESSVVTIADIEADDFRQVSRSTASAGEDGDIRMNQLWSFRRWALLSVAVALASACTGCQSDFGGQTLPSPWWFTDDVQYFPPGPEFKLSREAAALAAAKRDAATGGQPGMLQGQPPAPAPLAAPAGIGAPGVPPLGGRGGPAAPLPANPGAQPVINPAAAPGVIQ